LNSAKKGLVIFEKTAIGNGGGGRGERGGRHAEGSFELKTARFYAKKKKNRT